jgi:hypothetical protein
VSFSSDSFHLIPEEFFVSLSDFLFLQPQRFIPDFVKPVSKLEPSSNLNQNISLLSDSLQGFLFDSSHHVCNQLSQFLITLKNPDSQSHFLKSNSPFIVLNHFLKSSFRSCLINLNRNSISTSTNLQMSRSNDSFHRIPAFSLNGYFPCNSEKRKIT